MDHDHAQTMCAVLKLSWNGVSRLNGDVEREPGPNEGALATPGHAIQCRPGSPRLQKRSSTPGVSCARPS